MFMIPMCTQAQLDITTNPFSPDINISAQFKVIERLYVGGSLDYMFEDGTASAMVDTRFLVWELDKKVKIHLYNGFSFGSDGLGIATAYYFTEQFYYKTFPIGLSIYQRAYISNERSTYFEGRIGVVWNYYQKKKKKKNLDN